MLTPTQYRAIARITNGINNKCSCDGSWEFYLDIHCGDILLAASNSQSGLKWFEQSEFILISIGPKGGMKIRDWRTHYRTMLQYI